jgi:hypothetical protein
VNTRLGWIRSLIRCLPLIFITSCATVAQATPTAESTATSIPPTATSTSIPTSTMTPTTVPPTPTIELLPGAIPEGIVVTFSGKDKCTVSGPAELPPGDYTYIYRNRTMGTLDLVYLLDGHTMQDLLDIQGEPDRWFPKPVWAEYAASIHTSRNPSRNEVYTTFSLEEGYLVVYIYTQAPTQLWLCAPLIVR